MFRAVTEGACEFGVLPIENSTAGSVNAVYDLLGSHGCSIVRAVRLKIDHNLLAKPGATLADIREVVSHSQALNQCAAYLERLRGAHHRVRKHGARGRARLDIGPDGPRRALLARLRRPLRAFGARARGAGL